MSNKNENDTYIIPPNFVDTGTFFGGMFKARNVIEAGILAAAVGIPVCAFLPLGLTAKIIVLCLTALPLALFALVGISGGEPVFFSGDLSKIPEKPPYYRRGRMHAGGNSPGERPDGKAYAEGQGRKRCREGRKAGGG